MFKKLCGFLLAGVLLAGCGQDGTVAETELEPVTFGMMASIASIPVMVAQDEGLFEAEGLEVNLEFFPAARERDVALQAGLLDGLIGDMVAIGLFNEAGLDMQIMGATAGDFSLLTAGEYTSLEELRGQTIIVSSNTAAELALDRMLASAGLERDDIVREEVAAIPARLELLRSGQAAAAILPEPWVSMAVQSGLTSLLSTDDIGISPFVSTFSQEAIDAKPESIAAFYRAYDAAVEILNSRPSDSFYDLLIGFGFAEEIRESLILPEFTPNTLPEAAEVQAAFNWLLDLNLIETDFQPEALMSNIGIQ